MDGGHVPLGRQRHQEQRGLLQQRASEKGLQETNVNIDASVYKELYRLTHLIGNNLSLTLILPFFQGSKAICSYSSGPPAAGTSQT